MSRLLGVAVLLLGACATLPSAPTITPAPTVDPASTRSPTPAPTPTTAPIVAVTVGRWSAKCADVDEVECKGVAALFVNNLARNGASVFGQSGGTLSVEPRPECPAIPEWADPASCWQASANVSSGRICMVVAKQAGAGSAGFGQVGGDELAGQAGGRPKGWPTCT